MAEMPVTLAPVIDLAAQGINAQAFRFGNLTMESDKYISVKDTAPDGTSQVVTVDMHSNNAVSKRPMKAEATLMNPTDNFIALKGSAEGTPGHFVQVFNLDSKEKLGVYQSSEAIVFWKWITNRKLALVCAVDVYHWDLATPNSAPEKMFQRAGKLAEAGTQIIAYSSNATQSWCLLTGISTQDQGKTIDGNMQLYNVEKKQQQMLEGHAGCFGNVPVTDAAAPNGLFCFCERKVGNLQTKLHVMDVTAPRGEGLPAPFRAQMEIAMPPEAPSDFAVALHLSEKHGVIFMITKAGYLFVFDAATASMLVRTRVSQETIFISTGSTQTGGCIFVNRKGQVMSVKVNEGAIINYISNSLPQLANRADIAFALARRFGLPGADELFQRQFSQYFASGDYPNAARVAAQCKSGMLRTPQTIQQFKSVQAAPGQQSPLLHYFSTLLEYGKLNALESVELVRPVVQQQRGQLIEKWLKEDKLECTEELGDIVKPLDTRAALSIYVRGQSHQKVINAMVEIGQADQIVAYVKKVGFQADYSTLLQSMVSVNPQGAAEFAKSLLTGETGPLIDINMVVKVFMEQNRLQETTSVLLEALKGNRPDQAQLQTQLLAMNLQQAPKVAETILQMNMFTHYDKQFIGTLCEKAGLMQYALEHYQDPADVKRTLLHAHQMTPEFLQQFFGKMAPETGLECMYELMRHNRQNLQVVVQVAIKYHEQMGALKIVEMFESFGSHEGVFYLGLPGRHPVDEHRSRRALQVHPGGEPLRQHAGGRARVPREHQLQPGGGEGVPQGGQAARPAPAHLRVRPARVRQRADGVLVQELVDEVHRGLRVQGQRPELPHRHRDLDRLGLLRGLHQEPAPERASGLPHRAARGRGREEEPPAPAAAVARGAGCGGQPGPLPAQWNRDDLHRHEPRPRAVLEDQCLLRLRHRRKVLRGSRPAPRVHGLQARVRLVRRAAGQRHEQERPVPAAGPVSCRAPEPRALGAGAPAR
ncbi:unnamed protein product [Prorocentrum cordatum]|uniref:Clathrin heavy chain n=1 Tax=Prorocentrum cordatum TaxID=2364126 RepID=A0ABN9RQ16_9DINO|nr:unnamed protein product [Polarella glacialis]